MMMNRQQQQHTNEQEYYAKIFNELSTLILNIMRSPPSIDQQQQQENNNNQRLTFQQITPAGFASLLLGISLALMLCGSVTFFIGFFLMPWVIGLVMFLYFVAVISSVSMIGKAILSHTTSTPTKDFNSWKLL